MAEFRALRSVAMLLAAWAGGRVLLADWHQVDAGRAETSTSSVLASSMRRAHWQEVAVARTEPAHMLVSVESQPLAQRADAPNLANALPAAAVAALSGPPPASGFSPLAVALSPAPTPDAPALGPPPAFRPSPPSQGWSFSSWALWRDGRSPASLAPGQLAGSQTGLRIVAPSLISAGRTSLAPAMRLSSALSPVRQVEGALSVVAVHRGRSGRAEAFIERRFSIARGARNAFGAGVAGGGELTLASPGITLRAYGQAGIVGMRARDLYADWALSAERRVYESTDVDIAIGAGAWGGAQPGVSRADTGPFAAVTMRATGLPIRTTFGWRERVAGNAAPGSGPVVTIGADF